jgi:opacity protein-like surface antigen
MMPSVTRLVSWIAFAVLLTLAMALDAREVSAGSDGNINLLLGQKSPDEENWDSAEDHGEVSLDLMWRDDRWPIFANIYFSSAFYDNAQNAVFDVYDAWTTELGLGVKKVWDVGSVHPYVGVGLASITGEIDYQDPSLGEDRGGAAGLWVGAGAFVRLGERINLGLGGRYSSAEAEIYFDDTELGGLSISGILGWAWPAGR